MFRNVHDLKTDPFGCNTTNDFAKYTRFKDIALYMPKLGGNIYNDQESLLASNYFRTQTVSCIIHMNGRIHSHLTVHLRHITPMVIIGPA